MKKLLLILTLAGLPASLAGLPASLLAGDPPSDPARENAAAYLQTGDELYSMRSEGTGAIAAMRFYEAAASTGAVPATPPNILAEAHWKAARLRHWMGDHAQKNDKAAFFELGIEHAKKAIELEPQSAAAHFWLGALWGSYGEARGVMKSLSLVKPIRKEMEIVLSIDETFQGGAGHRVLGIVDYKVPAIAGGNKKRALERLEKALDIDPTNAFNRYYLAEYFEVVGEDEKAREQLDALDAATTTAVVDEPDLKMIQQKGATLRARLKKPKG